MDQIHDQVAGLDVHRDSVVACFRRLGPRGGVVREKERFTTTTAGLKVLEAWLADRRVERRLRRVMVRTERLAVTADRSGMLADRRVEARLERNDIRTFAMVDRLSRRLSTNDPASSEAK